MKVRGFMEGGYGRGCFRNNLKINVWKYYLKWVVVVEKLLKF